MTCEKCGGAPASVYLKQNVNGQVFEGYVCQACSGGIPMPNAYFPPSVPAELFNLIGAGNPSRPASRRRACPACKATLAAIAESGRAGCGECYSAFRPELTRQIAKIHSATAHVGKIPKRLRRLIGSWIY